MLAMAAGCPAEVYAAPPVRIGALRIPAPMAWARGDGSFLRTFVNNAGERVELEGAEHYAEFVLCGDVGAAEPPLVSPPRVDVVMRRARSFVRQLVVADYMIDGDYEVAVRGLLRGGCDCHAMTLFAFLVDLEVRAQGAEHVRQKAPCLRAWLGHLTISGFNAHVASAVAVADSDLAAAYSRELLDARVLSMYRDATEQCYEH
jgi:hypothetical protein